MGDLTKSGLLNKSIRLAAKSFLVMMAGGRCCVCGYHKSMSALSFHHLDRSTKKFEICGTRLTMRKEKLFEEAEKCALLCHNCHAEYHEGLIDDSKLVRISIDRTAVPGKLTEWFTGKRHGGTTFYKLMCPECETVFEREKRNSSESKKYKYSFCSNKCMGKFYKRKEPKQFEQVILEEFKKYYEAA